MYRKVTQHTSLRLSNDELAAALKLPAKAKVQLVGSKPGVEGEFVFTYSEVLEDTTPKALPSEV